MADIEQAMKELIRECVDESDIPDETDIEKMVGDHLEDELTSMVEDRVISIIECEERFGRIVRDMVEEEVNSKEWISSRELDEFKSEITKQINDHTLRAQLGFMFTRWKSSIRRFFFRKRSNIRNTCLMSVLF